MRTVTLTIALGVLGAGPSAWSPATASASSSSTARAPGLSPPAVTFDFGDAEGAEDIYLDKPLKLSFTLNGIKQGRLPLVAMIESLHFERQLVPIEQDSLSGKLQATVFLDPVPAGKLSNTPRFARIRVTVARAHADNRLERILTRIVYVTLDVRDAPASDVATASSTDEPESPGEDAPAADDVAPEGIPLADGSVAEEDVFVPSPTGQQQAYWDRISSLLSRSWSRTTRRVRLTPTHETVRIRFRMYPNGRAQLIEIEKGSGARDLDEAGIHAVIQAHPFPPFPEELGSEPVTVHVRMRMGAKARVRGVPSTIHSSPRFSTPASVPSP
ncbi:MAG: energy transducer TonB [Nitrospira sp.]|nr:energy transducer TonB [Nitrospira sp.]MCP9465399.1 energy transducer TonB [Nitrospira sp.]